MTSHQTTHTHKRKFVGPATPVHERRLGVVQAARQADRHEIGLAHIHETTRPKVRRAQVKMGALTAAWYWSRVKARVRRPSKMGAFRASQTRARPTLAARPQRAGRAKFVPGGGISIMSPAQAAAEAAQIARAQEIRRMQT